MGSVSVRRSTVDRSVVLIQNQDRQCDGSESREIELKADVDTECSVEEADQPEAVPRQFEAHRTCIEPRCFQAGNFVRKMFPVESSWFDSNCSQIGPNSKQKIRSESRATWIVKTFTCLVRKGKETKRQKERVTLRTGIEPDVGVEPTTLRFRDLSLKSLTLYRLS